MNVQRWARRLILVVAALAAAGAIVAALIPAPVAVETARAARGPMRVTVDEDGKTRIRERYTVSAPLAGRVERIRLKAGDAVAAGTTLLAVIDPAEPALLDPRAKAQAEARVSAADAAQRQAQATLAAAAAAHEQSQTELARLRGLESRGAAKGLEVEQAATAELMRGAEHKAAGFAAEIARFELEQARAALLRGGAESPDWKLEIRAPVSGRVLRVVQESEGVVGAGSPLLELGDPADLEARIDVLSTQAVPIRPGAPVIFEHWGGETPLHGVVRLVEPAAFTKISALGVEEQRVYVVVDFTDPPQARAALGDEFRVEARIVVWEQEGVLTGPAGALFRAAEGWSVFAVAGSRAVTRRVEIGKANAEQAQVLGGLAEGDEVVVYPGDRVRDGVRVRAR